jgi:hypothetical protein
VGKSTLAHVLLRTDRIPWLPTDVIRTVLRRVLPELDAVDGDPVDAVRLAELMYPHIEQAAEVCAEEAQRFLIEGFELAGHTRSGCAVRWWAMCSGLLPRAWHVLRGRSDLLPRPETQHEAQASPAELDQAAGWIRQRSHHLRDECCHLGKPYIDVDEPGHQVAMRHARRLLIGPEITACAARVHKGVSCARPSPAVDDAPRSSLRWWFGHS